MPQKLIFIPIRKRASIKSRRNTESTKDQVSHEASPKRINTAAQAVKLILSQIVMILFLTQNYWRGEVLHLKEETSES